MTDILTWLKDRKDPLATIIGGLVGLALMVGKTPAELVDWFLLMPTAQYVRLLSGIVLMLCCYFLFRGSK